MPSGLSGVGGSLPEGQLAPGVQLPGDGMWQAGRVAPTGLTTVLTRLLGPQPTAATVPSAVTSPHPRPQPRLPGGTGENVRQSWCAPTHGKSEPPSQACPSGRVWG